MGFTRSTLLLKFDDPQWEGFEVDSRRLSIDALLAIAGLRALNLRDTEAARKEFLSLAEAVGSVLIAWNLEEDELGEDNKPTGVKLPVPLTVANLAAQDYRMLFAIADALMDASAGVSPPLSPPSSDTDTSAEESIPMETSSESLPS